MTRDQYSPAAAHELRPQTVTCPAVDTNYILVATKLGYVTAAGEVWCALAHMLQPADTAYWWGHAGVVVRVKGAQWKSKQFSSCQQATLYQGSTWEAAYKHAAAHCENMH